MKLWKILTSKIFFKLFAVIILAVSIPFLMFQLLSFAEVVKADEESYLIYKQKLNNQIIAGIDENLDSLTRQSLAIYSHSDDLAIVLSENPLLYGSEYTRALNNIGQVSESYLQGNNKISTITFFALDGTVKLNSSRYISVAKGGSYANESWFSEIIENGGNPTFLSPHIPDYIDYRQQDPHTVISLAHAVIDFNTFEICGVMVIDQNASEFRQESFNVEIEANEQIAILDSKDEIVYSNTTQTEVFGDALSLIKTTDKKYINTNLGGEEVIISSNPSESYGWRVVSIIPKSTLVTKSDYLRKINQSIFFWVIILVLIISAIFANAIVSPLLRLKRGIDKTKYGDLGTKVNISGNDEIAQIGESFNEMSENLNLLIKDNYEINLLKKQAELEALQSQINPHFLFNTLNSIKGASDEYGSKQVSKMIKCLSDLFRYSLNKGDYIVSVSEEIEIVKKYLFIQQCRFGNKFDVVWDIENEILDERIVRLSLQPICENAFHHGLELSSAAGILSIKGWANDKNYYIEIANTGNLISDEELDSMNSLLSLNPETDREKIVQRVGVINVNSRIKFHFGNEYGVRFRKRNGYTIVKITLKRGT